MLVLDTNVVVWLAGDPGQISDQAQSSLASTRANGHGLAISTTTLWEISLLAARGKLAFNQSVDRFLERLEAVYRVLPLNRQIALAGARFSAAYPKDPADRQIGATALVYGMPLVTADKKIRASGEVPCIW